MTDEKNFWVGDWLGSLEEVKNRVRMELDSKLWHIPGGEWIEKPKSDEGIENITKQLLQLHETLRPAFLNWWNKGTFDENLKVGSYTFASVRGITSSRSPIEVFIWLDRLTKDPEEAYKGFAGAHLANRNKRLIVEGLN